MKAGLKCIIYLDDLLFLMPPNAAAKFRLRLLQCIFTSFGLAISSAKSDLCLKSRREHLGLIIDFHARAFRVS